MRKLLENWITAVVALATLVLSVIWFLKNKEIEPLIGIVASLGVLVTAGVYRLYPEKKEDPQPTFISKTEKNTVKKSTLTAQSIHIGDVLQYADRKIPRNLTAPPFDPPVFLGRTTELQQVHDRLFAGENFLMLVNGQGGIGKTSFAAKYWARFHGEYQHRAFLYVGDGIADAMLSIAPALGVVFPEAMPTAQRLQTLLQAIGNLERPCLIVLDNANDRKDLDAHYQLLRRCTNCHLLITSRLTEFRETAPFPIGVLPEGLPLELFKTHYPAHRSADDPLFEGIFRAVGGNTLVVEILAKNLHNINQNRVFYPLEKLLHDLQSRGLLRLTEQTNVQVNWQSFETSKPEDIIAAMYDLRPLDAASLALLCAFAVLPPENIAYDTLEALLAPDDPRPFSETLTALNQTGWIERNAPAGGAVQYKCSPVVQEVVRAKSEDLLTLCRPLIKALIAKTNLDVLHIDDYRPATLYTRYAEALVAAFEQKYDSALGELCQNAGSFYSATGDLGKAVDAYQKMADIFTVLAERLPDNLEFKDGLATSYQYLGHIQAVLGNLGKALAYFEEYKRINLELYKLQPATMIFKNGLAISYEKLGNMQVAMGNLEKALAVYIERNRLSKELHESYPTNVDYKNGLAISYEKLGNTQAALGNLAEALAYYEERNRLGKELHESYPTNVDYKNSLAISYSKLGETQAELGNLAKALAFYEELNRLEKELHKSYPTSVEFKNGLATSYSKLGDTQVELGNLDKAMAYFEEYNRLAKELSESYPTIVNYKNGLAISYQYLGIIQSALGNLDKAVIFYEEYNRLEKDLHNSYPTNVSFKDALAVSNQFLGETQAVLGNLKEALAYYEEYNRLEKELHESYPMNVSFKNSLAISYSMLGSFYQKHRQDSTKARNYYLQGLSLAQALVNDHPGYAKFQKSLNWFQDALARLDE